MRRSAIIYTWHDNRIPTPCGSQVPTTNTGVSMSDDEQYSRSQTNTGDRRQTQETTDEHGVSMSEDEHQVPTSEDKHRVPKSKDEDGQHRFK
jgi:hypothetical protein